MLGAKYFFHSTSKKDLTGQVTANLYSKKNVLLPPSAKIASF